MPKSIFIDQSYLMSHPLAQQTITGSNQKQAAMYCDLVHEESSEFLTAGSTADKVKEAVDVIVVATGYLISVLGVDGAQEAWDLVHASNMAKFEGDVELREDGKILQNAHFKAVVKPKMLADVSALVSRFE